LDSLTAAGYELISLHGGLPEGTDEVLAVPATRANA